MLLLLLLLSSSSLSSSSPPSAKWLYSLVNRDWIPGLSKKFLLQSPDQFWGPHNGLANGYRCNINRRVKLGLSSTGLLDGVE
jgi:hypothetical protein